MTKKISFFLLFLITGVYLNGQTVQAPTDAYLNLELVSAVVVSDSLLTTTFDPMALVSPTDTMLVSVSMIVPDTNLIHKIHIKLGSSFGSNDLIDQQFDYDVDLSAPQMYLREADMIKICFGEYLNSNVFYCEIKLEDHSGNISTITNCQSNQ